MVLVNCVHPGLIKGDLFRSVGHCFPPFFGTLGVISEWLAGPFFRSASNGALTTLWAATSPKLLHYNVHGEYIAPCAGWRLPQLVTDLINRLDPLARVPPRFSLKGLGVGLRGRGSP